MIYPDTGQIIMAYFITNLDIEFSGEWFGFWHLFFCFGFFVVAIAVLGVWFCFALLCFGVEKKGLHHSSQKLERNSRKDLEPEFFLSPSKDAAPARLGQRAGQCWGSHTWPRRTCFVKKYVMSSYEAAVWLQLRPFQNDEHRLAQRVVLTQLQQDGVLLCFLGDITSILQKGSYPVSSSGCYNCGL